VISHNIKWFLGLSVAVHTAALVAWSASEHVPGHSGQVLLLAVHNQTGKAAVQQEPTSSPTRPAPRQPTAALPETTAAAVKQPSARQPVTRPPVEVPAAVIEPAPEQKQEQEQEQVHTEQTSYPAQAASSAPSHEQQDQHLRASVMDFVAQQLNYPAIARRKGWQGVVKLKLHIEPDGLISELHIDETSGYAALDEAALESLQLANIPNAAQWLHGETTNIIIPVEYRLIDG
jgi:protein TonB